MRPNNVSAAQDASLQTRGRDWFSSLPLGTRGVFVLCGGIYVCCVLFGYDAFGQVCMAPRWVLYNGEGHYLYSTGGREEEAEGGLSFVSCLFGHRNDTRGFLSSTCGVTMMGLSHTPLDAKRMARIPLFLYRPRSPFII